MEMIEGKLVFQLNELPVGVSIVGENGKRKEYELAPAGKGKVGAHLRGVTELVRRVVVRTLRRK